MSQADNEIICSICGEEPLTTKQTVFENPLYEYCECERCGKFVAHRLLCNAYLPDTFYEVRHFISAWIRRENNHGNMPRLIETTEEAQDIDRWLSRFKRMGFPESTSEKLNSLLLAYAESSGGDYQYGLTPNKPQLVSEAVAKSKDEVEGLTKLLYQLGFVSKFDEPQGGPMITAKGWLRVEELKKSIVASDSAFIAMWFNETTEAFRDSVIAAVEYCGYRAIIVDQEEFSGFIMDQIISLIRSCRFLIADFTCKPEQLDDSGNPKYGVRGGVYWESGMAYGMGKSVIHTCQNDPDVKARIHFDVDQYNTIFWQPSDLGITIRDLQTITDNPSFAEKLVARILNTIGRGSYTPS